jgi:alkylresorcinol/alkylpyrone synthase
MAIARAHDYLKGHPHDRLLLLGVELPSLTFQPQDRSHDAVLSAMIFGDGAAAFVMTGDAGTGPRIVATQSTLVPDTLDVMGFDLRDRGFHIRLTNDVIPTVNTHLRSVVQGFLAEHEMVPRDLTFAVLHPGGARILDAVQELLGLDEGILGPTRASLAANGNMSSVSVMDIVDRLHASPPDAGSYGLLAGFGPGFSVELGLLQWQ